MSKKQTEKDLYLYLKEQLDFLHLSALSYDKGFIGEAKRLATTISVLVHDTNSSQSLLGQLGIKDMSFYDTGWLQDLLRQHEDKSHVDTPYIGRHTSPRLVSMAIMDGPKSRLYVPYIDKNIEKANILKFEEWWGQIVIGNQESTYFTRKDVVQTLRNKLGGAHIDPSLNDKFADLVDSETNAKILLNNNLLVSDSPEHGTVRQIAYELQFSIGKHFCNQELI